MLENDDFYPNISHIVCMDKFGIIGINNKMPWHIPTELKYFKSVTEDSIVIMGSNTFYSIGHPLPNRINIVISKKLNLEDTPELYVRDSIENAIDLAWYLGLKEKKNIFIIGGSSIYEQTISYINKAYITVLDVSYYNKIQQTENNKFVYYPYEQVIDSGFKLIESKPLETKDFFYRISTNILEKNNESTNSESIK